MRATLAGLAGAAALIMAMPGWAAEPVPVDQGPQWTNDARTAFYGQEATGIIDIGQHDLGAFARQSIGAGGTDTRCAAGDNRDFTIHLTHDPVPLQTW